ncbi:hypothetical protein BKA64DRAFT_437343 [Cadophora sp. MPI-SDFR-AT-0126]|nr:hypothetical protein BKA64DRAFT_437343 [Leotiomycetes sp. MPI-SDFR-AT-0126]
MKSVSKQLEDHKSVIEDLYIQEGKTAKEVLSHLFERFDFRVTENQLKKKLNDWGFNTKNIRAETMVQIARSRAKPGLENKQSAFRVNKKPVHDRNIDEFMYRKEISMEDLMEIQSPHGYVTLHTSVIIRLSTFLSYFSSVQCLTPETTVSSPILVARSDVLPQESSPTSDFNMLSITDTRSSQILLKSYPVVERHSVDMVEDPNVLQPDDVPNSGDSRVQLKESSDPAEGFIRPLGDSQDKHCSITEATDQVQVTSTITDGKNDSLNPVNDANISITLNFLLSSFDLLPKYLPSSSEPPSDIDKEMVRKLKEVRRLLGSRLWDARYLTETERYFISIVNDMEFLPTGKISSSTTNNSLSLDTTK